MAATPRLVPRFIRTSFRAKLFVAFMLLAGGATIDTSIYIGRLLRQVQLTEFQSLMLGTVIQMAGEMDEDALHHLAAADDVGGDPAFTAERDRLLAMRRTLVREMDRRTGTATADAIFVDVYVLAPTDDPGTGRLVVTYVEDEAGRPYDMMRFPEMMAGWDAATVESAPVTDEYGTTLSAYAPVRDESGAAIALVGLDAAGVYFDDMILETVVVTFGMFVAAIVFSMLCSWIITRVMSKSLLRLSDGMSAVADGDLARRVEPTGSGDEFDVVIEQFNEMVEGLRERRMIKRDLVEAGQIQARLLPHDTPTIDGFDVAGGIQYCRQAGGDYFDYVSLDGGDDEPDAAPSGPWAIVVGDVTGHGVGSALMMASTRAVLRSAVRRYGTNVPGLLRYVNDHLVHDSPPGAFMTMFYGVLDPAQHALTWSNAGHDPGLVVRRDGAGYERLDSTDIPLGIERGRRFEVGTTTDFAPGDVLVVGTDGLSQSRDRAGSFFGFERITAVVRANPDASAAVLRDRILDAERAHRGGRPIDDDVTIVVVKRR